MSEEDGYHKGGDGRFHINDRWREVTPSSVGYMGFDTEHDAQIAVAAMQRAYAIGRRDKTREINAVLYEP